MNEVYRGRFLYTSSDARDRDSYRLPRRDSSGVPLVARSFRMARRADRAVGRGDVGTRMGIH